MSYTVFDAAKLEWVPRGDDDTRTVARLSDSMTHSRANIWRYPPGARGKRHADQCRGIRRARRHTDGSISASRRSATSSPAGGSSSSSRVPSCSLRNAGDEELVLFIYGAPPEQG
jgi:hypothetical protein